MPKCPKCQYVLMAGETECPRCKLAGETQEPSEAAPRAQPEAAPRRPLKRWALAGAAGFAVVAVGVALLMAVGALRGPRQQWFRPTRSRPAAAPAASGSAAPAQEVPQAGPGGPETYSAGVPAAQSAAMPGAAPTAMPSREAPALEQPRTPAQDLLDLVEQGAVDARTEGAGIDAVAVYLQRRASAQAQVRIAPGTFFACGNPRVQNMMATEQVTVNLPDSQWQVALVPAVSTNLDRSIPTERDHFAILRAPEPEQLAALAPLLAETDDFAVRQAAVWIVTDNADYADLGALVDDSGARVITEPEATLAMALVDEAGIDITRKAIWHDRPQIMARLRDPDLKAWLEQRGAG